MDVFKIDHGYNCESLMKYTKICDLYIGILKFLVMVITFTLTTGINSVSGASLGDHLMNHLNLGQKVITEFD